MVKGKEATATEPSAGAGKNKWAALAVLALGLAVIILDGTIVGVSMPTIIEDLDLDLSSAQWVTSLYSVEAFYRYCPTTPQQHSSDFPTAGRTPR